MLLFLRHLTARAPILPSGRSARFNLRVLEEQFARAHLSRFFSGQAQYTLGKTYNNTSGVTYFPATAIFLGSIGRAPTMVAAINSICSATSSLAVSFLSEFFRLTLANLSTSSPASTPTETASSMTVPAWVGRRAIHSMAPASSILISTSSMTSVSRSGLSRTPLPAQP
jgi:hypothetical protein